uniref:Uncharacterized protein n=1 Tax=Myoviridae sp. ctCo31 TaxID=2825053 RepID=A0A8S5UMD9_9CAUD|nr:MAG TPA: hypothetical protein [Myoviridae sp. ctCo31]
MAIIGILLKDKMIINNWKKQNYVNLKELD